MKGHGMMGVAVGCGLLIFVASLVVAYVLFGILESSGSAELRQWKLGGAFAGFAFTAGLLASTVLQLYREMRRTKERDYVRQIQELQSKVIRGAPKPPGFTIDVDERHQLVFARPEGWRHKAGALYSYEDVQSDDSFPANFNVFFTTPIDLAGAFGLDVAALGQRRPVPDEQLEAIYRMDMDNMLNLASMAFDGYRRESFAEEYVFVDGLKSVRYTHTYWTTKDGVDVKLTQVGVDIFQPLVPGLFTFTFTDNSEDFLDSSEQFNQVVSSIRFLT